MRRRIGRAAFLVAAFVLLATITRAPPPPEPRGPAEVPLEARPVPLDSGAPQRRRLGPLVYLGGWSLSAPDPRFGAVSAIHVGDREIAAIGDGGVLLRFDRPDMAARPAVRIDQLVHAQRKSGRDSEAMAIAGDSAWIAFESRNAVGRYRLPGWTAEARARPAAMRRWPRNGGAEAMVRLAGGRFLLLAEGGDDDSPTSEALLFDRDPTDPAADPVRLSYRRVPGFRASDAALLPDGRLLVLNRRFRLPSGFAAALVVADLSGLRPGEAIEGEVVAVLRAPLAADNMEALAVTREGGRTIVWIASDDNFTPLQRTLLLKFAWLG